ncbi:hypothetical protein [Ilumatobacter nonamiensis]|uniref:hypothetical protein n=1 Tax=Ilumatobacter nonamiensis TaxID=467093 RepID=UPI000347F1BD|nr:hypothetical protein [Ilumatobacter nonamiensis]
MSEITSITKIRQGFVQPIEVMTRREGDHDVQYVGIDTAAPPVRYVDNLRMVFELVRLDTSKGNWTPLNDVGTIHFARWVILPDDEHLLFCSNFDGSFDQYIHDFVSIANSGEKTRDNPSGAKWMDMIWGNCVGYPGTADFQRFLAYIRDSMVETTLFFPTIDDVTVRDISWLRQFRKHFIAFDEAAQGVDPTSWPVELRSAYDEMKAKINEIDVTDV